MSRVLFIIMSFAASVVGACAQQLSDEDRDRWLTEMRNYKHDYLARELNLTREQQNEFFPLYDSMEDEINRLNAETRELERRALAEDASDTELSAVARQLFEQKSAEGAVEISYYDKFKQILTPKQLIRIKNLERRFTQQLVHHHRRMYRRDTDKQ